jgi:hypothetical protein
MQKFVIIVNRGTPESPKYTNPKKALAYVARGLAAVEACSDNGHLTHIRMLEAAELAATKSALRRYSERDPVTGNFVWMVGDSGGSRLMKQYEGISGGTRVLMAEHGN